MADNRYYHGLSNVHYSVVTETTNSTTGEVETTYETVLNDNNLIWRKDSDYNSTEKINYSVYTTEVF